MFYIRWLLAFAEYRYLENYCRTAGLSDRYYHLIERGLNELDTPDRQRS